MNDDFRSGKPTRTAYEMDRRLTTIEVQMVNLATKLDAHVAASNALIDRLDLRQDRADVFAARLIGGLIVAQFMAILFAPVIRGALGLSIT